VVREPKANSLAAQIHVTKMRSYEEMAHVVLVQTSTGCLKTEDNACKTSVMVGKKSSKMEVANTVKNTVELIESIFISALPPSVVLDNSFFPTVCAKIVRHSQEVFLKSFADLTPAIACRFSRKMGLVRTAQHTHVPLPISVPAL